MRRFRFLYNVLIGLLPFRLALTLRSWKAEGKYSAIVSPVLGLLRYRHIPASISNFTISDQPKLQLCNDHSLLSRRVFWLGHAGYEQDTIGLWMELCKAHNHVLEIGANMGYFTIHGKHANPDIRYTAVEPHPGSFRYMQRNIALNKMQNVNLIEAAVAGDDAPEHMMLRIPNINAQDSSPTGAFLETVQGLGRKADSAVKVAVTSAGPLIAGADLLKLDVEGSEYEILESVKETVLLCKPTILVEVLRNTGKLRSLIRYLALHHNYLIYAVKGMHLYAVKPETITEVVLQQAYGTRDLILIQPERLRNSSEKIRIESDSFRKTGPEIRAKTA